MRLITSQDSYTVVSSSSLLGYLIIIVKHHGFCFIIKYNMELLINLVLLGNLANPKIWILIKPCDVENQ